MNTTYNTELLQQLKLKEIELRNDLERFEHYQNELKKEIKNEFTGANNKNNLVINFANDDDGEPNFHDLNIESPKREFSEIKLLVIKYNNFHNWGHLDIIDKIKKELEINNLKQQLCLMNRRTIDIPFGFLDSDC